MTLDALETVLSESPREDHRHRIEHLGNTLDVARLDRAQRLGVIPVPTAAGIWSTRDERARQTDGPPRRPYRSLIARGFRPPGNSDTAGTRTYAINPMLNVSWLVTRRNRNGVVVQPEDESLSVLDALRVQSLFGAYAGFEENVKGSLEPGKLADLVVLSEDPLEAAPERLADIVMDLTMIDGVVRYERR